MDRYRPWRRVTAMFSRRSRNNSGPISAIRSGHETSMGFPRVKPMERLMTRSHISNLNECTPSWLHDSQWLVRPFNPQLNNSTEPSSLVVNNKNKLPSSYVLGEDNRDSMCYFIPRCLSNVNCQGVLMGQEAYDDYSSSCWLEDHLHQFAPAIDDLSADGESVRGGAAALTAGENFTFTSMSSRLTDANQSLPIPEDLRHIFDSFDETLRSHSSNRSVDNGVSIDSSSSGHSSPTSTLSYVTEVYNNMNLSSLAQPEQPPPYTERPEDPPPTYAEAVHLIGDCQRPRRYSQRASVTLFSDVLW